MYFLRKANISERYIYNPDITELSYISGNGTLPFLNPGLKNERKKSTLKQFLYFQEMELSGSNIKKFLIFQETETLKNFLQFRK